MRNSKKRERERDRGRVTPHYYFIFVLHIRKNKEEDSRAHNLMIIFNMSHWYLCKNKKKKNKLFLKTDLG